ncbi:MAG: trans-sulfuration enzyme family protein [Chitinophagales bacterium]
MDISHIINHLGEDRSNYYQAVSPPIFQSSNFTFESIDKMRHSLTDEMNTPFYTRGCNPTVSILRKKIAALAQAEDSLIFSSGSAAICAAVISQVKAGEHIICVAKPYGWTNKLLTVLLSRFGVTHTFVDGTNAENFEKAIQNNTKLIFLESPNSITFELQDVAAVVKIAKKHNLVTIMDNSYATPLYQSAIAMGIDITVHSASKYLNGHSDIVAGALCSSEKICRHIFEGEFMTLGGIISPNDAFLMLRGLRTLPIRLERVTHNTLIVTDFLAQHEKVEKLNYPFHKDFPQYELAKKQMKGAGGLFSMQIKAENIVQVEAFCNHLKRFLLACSWGGHESLIFPICVLHTSENYSNVDLPWNLVRFYIGLEDPKALIDDLQKALDFAFKI